MTEESKQLYLVNDPQMNRHLQSISDRLDRLEGLRDYPKFYKGTFQYGVDITEGQVLTASSGDASFEDISITIIGDYDNGNYTSFSSNGLIAVYAEGTKIHSFGG